MLIFFLFLDDWRLDGYRWFQYGTKLLLRNNPEVKKIHLATVLPSSAYNKRFRQAFFLISRAQEMVLLHCIGDENITVSFPHKNSKHDQIFHRTYPSIQKELALKGLLSPRRCLQICYIKK